MSTNEEARKNDSARKADTNDRYLTFQLGSDPYAIPLLQVKEVIEMQEPTPIAEMPSYFKGIINLRGQVVSVIDLRAKLKLANITNGPKTAIIILDLDPTLSLGVVVDRINSVQAFSHSDLSDPPELHAGSKKHLTAVAKRDNKLTLILDIAAALNLSDLKKQDIAA